MFSSQCECVRPCGGALFLSPGSPSNRICSACQELIGKEAYISTPEKLTVHRRCFVCSKCKCSLSVSSYGTDLNGKFYCMAHMKSCRPSDSAYKTLASGWLFKQGAVVKKWRRRFFVLHIDSCELEYYKSEDTTTQQKKGIIDLSTVASIQPAYLFVPPDKSHPEYPSGSLPALQLITRSRIWNLTCETDSVREYWLDAIRTAQATSASPAASSSVGRGSRGHSSRGPTLSTSPSPPPFQSSALTSPPRVPLAQPRLSSPLASSVKSSMPIPTSVLSPPGNFTQETDDAETSSPDDDDCTAAQESRSRTGSGLGRGDGSAQASQFVAPNGIKRLGTLPPPIVVPQSSFMSNNSTPTIPNGSYYMTPGSPMRKPHNCGGESPWQPSTPRGLTGCAFGVANGDSENGWDSGSTSSSTNSHDYQMHYLRNRAVSAGASYQPQMRHVALPCVGVATLVPAKPSPGLTSPKFRIGMFRKSTTEADKDSLLCSPHTKQPSNSGTTKAIPSADGDAGLSSFVFYSSSTPNLDGDCKI